MGCEALRKQSKDQLAKHIRQVAKVTANVVLTVHMKRRMRERKVTASMVYECMRIGQIVRVPEENQEKGTLECRMERYCAGCNCTVVVALDDDDPDLICVTAWIEAR